MFEPDGRNDIQYAGHLAITGLKWIMYILGIFALAPTVLFFAGKEAINMQEASIRVINGDPRAINVVVDFNVPTLRLADAATLDPPFTHRTIEPKTRALPFSVVYLDRSGATPSPEPPGVGDKGLGAAWIWYHLPFDEGMTYDENFYGAEQHWHFWHGTSAIKTGGIADLNEKYQSPAFTDGDPWYTQGLYRMGPTKKWDWSTGYELIHAKASFNYRAYVVAARTVARMRYLVAVRKTGGWFDPDQRAYHYQPVWGLHDATDRPKFLEAYTNAFNGKLPRIVLTVQDLDEQALTYARPFRPEGRQGWGIEYKWKAQSTGAFVTGLRDLDHPDGKPWTPQTTFAYGDFLWRHSPYIPDETKAVQDKLLALLNPEFWDPLLRAEGITDEDSFKMAHALLEGVRKQTLKDTRWAKVYGHRAYESY